MLIEIVQHESNKVVREATLEEAKAFRATFPVNLVDEHGNRTPFELETADSLEAAPLDEQAPQPQDDGADQEAPQLDAEVVQQAEGA